MTARNYILASAILFALVALAHLVRIVEGWPVMVGTWNAPMWVSWVGLIVPGVLACWGFYLVGRKTAAIA